MNQASLIQNIAKEFYEGISNTNLFDKILKLSVQFTNSDRATLYLDKQFEDSNQLKYLKSYLAIGIKNQSIQIDISRGIAGQVFKTKTSYMTNAAASDPNFNSEVDQKTGYKTQSVLAVPLYWKNQQVIGVLQVLNKKNGEYSPFDQQALEFISILTAMAIDNYEIQQKSLDDENQILHKKQVWNKKIDSIFVKSGNEKLKSFYENLNVIGSSDSNILITGESGTGKEVAARLIHHHSQRAEGPFIAINCAAIPDTLFEAELFGVAKGAATGTVARKGQVELAHHGTLFLDEIGELPLEMQAKLLRVLQERKVVRLGSNEEPKEIDFRLLSATNKNLEEMVKEGKFREDLYYRICVMNVKLPSLKERKDDIPELVPTIMQKLHNRKGWKNKNISDDALKALMNYSWPGNIRELENKIESALILSGDKDVIGVEHFQLSQIVTATSEVSSSEIYQSFLGMSFKDAKHKFEMELALKVIELHSGNKSEAARQLGLSREGLRKVLNKASS